ncbi:hypothetical protein [Paenibacillus xylanexedens]|uniref:hypothetical protein n=1 Tax=Paenibacillus xylanexedens TaxID=528191 RepID=UPI001C8E0374|nr:hypothetical protein [Paenibacillus xylanexedens]MBY0117988.1 hypothetical protein [Paenibacillus xylanexedens]
MEFRFGIDQSVLDVPVYIQNSLNRLRYAGYKVGPSCRFEIYRNKFSRLYLNAIRTQNYSLNNSDQEELLFGYKDYWELKGISESNIILSSTNKAVKDEINNIFSGGILEGKDPKPWNYQFQFNLSSIFEHSGFQVELLEPDFIFGHKGRKYSVAAKRLISKNSIQANIEKAEAQIKLTDNYGFIALSLDKIFKDFNEVITIDDADKSIRKANEIILNIIREDFLAGYFGRRDSQVLGIIAYVSFPYFLKSRKPMFELGYTSYLMFLPTREQDSSGWNEVIEISQGLRRINMKMT